MVRPSAKKGRAPGNSRRKVVAAGAKPSRQHRRERGAVLAQVSTDLTAERFRLAMALAEPLTCRQRTPWLCSPRLAPAAGSPLRSGYSSPDLLR